MDNLPPEVLEFLLKRQRRNRWLIPFVPLLILWWTLRWIWSAWTTPNTASSSTVISASSYNTYVRDNLNYLFSQRPIGKVHYVGAGDITNGTATWAAADTTNLRLTTTINSGRVLLFVSCELQADNTASSAAEIDIQRDGTTRLGHATHGMARVSQNTQRWVSAMTYDSGLSVGSHYWDLMLRNVTGGAVATIKNNGFPVNMFVIEC